MTMDDDGTYQTHSQQCTAFLHEVSVCSHKYSLFLIVLYNDLSLHMEA